MAPAAVLWWSLVSVVVFTALWGLAVDLALISANVPSMTDYLRRNVWAFWYPIMGALVAFIILFVHLWIRATNGD